MTSHARPVGAVAVVCRDFDPSSAEHPHLHWALVLPEMVRMGVEVTMVRAARTPAEHTDVWRGVVVRGLRLPTVVDAPDGADDAVWALAAAGCIAALDDRRPLAVVEAPLQTGDAAHLAAATQALRVVWSCPTTPAGPMARALAAEARDAADLVVGDDDGDLIPPPVAVPTRPTRAGDGRVVVLGGSAAHPDWAPPDDVVDGPVSAARLGAHLADAAMVVVRDARYRRWGMAALCAGIPVVTTTDWPWRDRAGLVRSSPQDLPDAVSRVIVDHALRRRAQAEAWRVRRDTSPSRVARTLIALYEERRGGLPPDRWRRVGLGSITAIPGLMPAGTTPLAAATVVAERPAVASPCWTGNLTASLTTLGEGIAGPVGYAIDAGGDAPELVRCPPGAHCPAEVLAGPVSAVDGAHTPHPWRPGLAAAVEAAVTVRRRGGAVRQVTGAWPAPASAQRPPLRLPLPEGSRAALRDAGGPWTSIARPRDGFHPSEAGSPEGLDPRWMADRGTIRLVCAHDGAWRLTLEVESFEKARALTITGPRGAAVWEHVPAGERVAATVELDLPRGAVDLLLTTTPGAVRPSEIGGSPDDRALSIRLWWAIAERRGA